MTVEKFVYYLDNKNEWRWKFIGKNGEVIAVSSEGYVRAQDCTDAIDLVKSTTGATPVVLETHPGLLAAMLTGGI